MVSPWPPCGEEISGFEKQVPGTQRRYSELLPTDNSEPIPARETMESSAPDVDSGCCCFSSPTTPTLRLSLTLLLGTELFGWGLMAPKRHPLGRQLTV